MKNGDKSSCETVASSSGSIEEELCHCRKVSVGKIIQAIDCGMHDLPQIVIRTRAGSGCGTCRSQILELLESRLKKKAS